MFWTNNSTQLSFTGDDKSSATRVISELYQQAVYIFGDDQEQDVYRLYMFLTHGATQEFLKPLLINKFKTLDAAKLPTIEWLSELGSLETFARTVRGGHGSTKTVAAEARKVPDWYTKYLSSARWEDAKARAKDLWTNSHFPDGRMRCSFNHRHEFSEWHHADYGLIGTGAEFRTLIPMCRSCHGRNRIVGPSIPQQIPPAVKPWIEAKETSQCR